MADAIPVQIKVVKQRGGASRIEVPGWNHNDTLNIEDDGDHFDSNNDESPEALSRQLISILQRERNLGKDKVSAKAIREELQCDSKSLKAAQLLFGSQVEIDGRSLRMV